MKKIFENAYAELYDISEEVPHTMFGYWRGFWELQDEEAMAALLFPLNYIKEHGIKIMLTDYKDLDVVSEETDQWLAEYWFPTVVKNGLKAEIILDAEEMIGQISVDFMYENVDANTGLYTRKADTLEHAKELAMAVLQGIEENKLPDK